jgi:predicted ATPase/DNA-binding winged helix-turn-helix (wHTH) protein
MTQGTSFAFGHFELHADSRTLLAGGRPVKVGGRAFDVLLALVSRPDRVVSKHELMDIVWPSLVVEENNLNVQIVVLRKLLGHSAVATVPGRGFRFALPVTQTGALSGPSMPASAVPPTPDAATPSPCGNLPAQLPVLYGREDDVATLSMLLRSHPIVTVTGAGGIGKTRLAQHVALRVGAEYPEGAWWVELASLSHGALVATAVAQVLGIDFGGRQDPLRTLVSWLSGRHLLLVLDNCEHVLDAVSAFAEAAAAGAPELRLLVTSQEVLRVGNEHVFRLDTLSLPAQGPALTPAALAASGAGALFSARASAVDPRFQITASNVQSVLDICRRLDGIPLAIELAASRLPLLGVEGLRAKLNQRFNVLTGGARAVLRRHQTLRAALDWSHGLLSAPEQAVFRRIGVFAGGFTLEAAQRVAEDDAGIDAWDVLEHLGALIDKSLVLAEGDPLPRYRLLETTRLFALERLGESGETDTILRRHVEAMTEVLQVISRARHLRPLSEVERAGLAVEADNVRAALGWLEQLPNDNGAVDDLAIALGGEAGYALGQANGADEGFARTLPLRTRIHAATPPAVAARYWHTLAMLGSVAGHAESYEAAVRGADLYAQLNDDARRFGCLIAQIACGARRAVAASLAPVVEEAWRLEAGQQHVYARTNFRWACYRWLNSQGRSEEALACSHEQVRIAHDAGLHNAAQQFLGDTVADCELALGHLVEAEAHCRSALYALQANGAPHQNVAHVVDTLARVLAAQGQHDEALATGRRALQMTRSEGFHFRLLEPLARCAAEQGRLRDAAWVTGYVDATYARHGEVRWPAVAAQRARLDEVLAAGLDGPALQALRADGARGDERVAFAKLFGMAVTEPEAAGGR